MATPATKYGLRYTVSLIPGDGVGKELCRSVQSVFAAARVPVDFEEVHLSGHSKDSHDLQHAIASLKKNRIGLKGIIYTPTIGPQTSINVAIRQLLDIYANVVQIRSLPGCSPRYPDIDMIVIRENTEGEYSGLEHQPVPGVVESLKVTTREKSRRIVQFAFDYAVQNGRRKVTCVHKANIMKLTDGLFLRTFLEVAEQNRHTGITAEQMIVDNMAMQLVSRPNQFDVIVTPNLYGNIVSNIGAGLVGSAGLIPGYNIGRDYAIFEPGARHVGRDIEGQNSANPVSMLLSSVFMLRHLGLGEFANSIHDAVMKTMTAGKHLTPDIRGCTTTTDFTTAVTKHLL